MPTTIFVIGASGDLAQKKIFPSLYELFINGLLPQQTTVFGYARSAIADNKFHDGVAKYLTAGTAEQKRQFLALIIYRHGGYDDAAAFGKVCIALLRDVMLMG